MCSICGWSRITLLAAVIMIVPACTLATPEATSTPSSHPSGGIAQITFEGAETGSASSTSVTSCMSSSSRFLVVMDGQVGAKRFRVGLIVPSFHGDGSYTAQPVGVGVGPSGQGIPGPKASAGQEVGLGGFGNLDFQDSQRAISIDEVGRTRVDVHQGGHSGSFQVAYAPVVGDIPDNSKREMLTGTWACG